MPWIELVDKRTRSSKQRVDSLNPRRFAIDASVGAIHYKDNEQWKEIDNVFEPALTPWDWQMLRAGYHIKVKEDFTAGQIIEFEKQGETVQFQPMALEWTNDLDQIQQISMPQSVTPDVTNPEVDLLPEVGVPGHMGTIRWNNAYGEGLDFLWRCVPSRLVKILQIENLSRLPVPEQPILDGGNPTLRLNLIFDPSNSVDILIDGAKWNKSTKKQTFTAIEFRKDGEVLWNFVPLRYWGSGRGEDNEGHSVATLEKRGNKFYISIRVPYEWLQNATYPVFIDTDIDEQIGHGKDDGYTLPDISVLRMDYAFVTIDDTSYVIHGYYRFTGLAAANGETINAAYISLYAQDATVGSSDLRVHCIDQNNTANFDTTYAELSGRPVTTAYTDWAPGSWTDNNWYDSDDLAGVFQEMSDSGYLASGVAAVKCITSDTLVVRNCDAYEHAGLTEAKLHLEYGPQIYDETGREQVVLASQSRAEIVSRLETEREQVLLAVASKSDLATFGELENQVVLAIQSKGEQLTKVESREQVILGVVDETDLATFSETLSQTILAVIEKIEQLIKVETREQVISAVVEKIEQLVMVEGREQTILGVIAETDLATFLDTLRLQTILATANESDLVTFLDTLKLQVVLEVASETDLATFLDIREQVVLAAQSGDAYCRYQDLGLSQTILGVIGESDLATFYEIGKTLTILVTQEGWAGTQFWETNREQVVLVTMSTIAGFVFPETEREQTILGVIGKVDQLTNVEKNLEQVILVIQSFAQILVVQYRIRREPSYNLGKVKPTPHNLGESLEEYTLGGRIK